MPATTSSKRPTPTASRNGGVQSNYILVTVLGLAPERVNIAHARRLRTVMQKLGWTGSKNLRFRGRQAKGFYKAAEDA